MADKEVIETLKIARNTYFKYKKEMKEAMISLLEEDRKRIAEDEALAREEFLAAKKDNGVIAARLTRQ